MQPNLLVCQVYDQHVARTRIYAVVTRSGPLGRDLFEALFYLRRCWAGFIAASECATGSWIYPQQTASQNPASLDVRGVEWTSSDLGDSDDVAGFASVATTARRGHAASTSTGVA